MGRSTLGILALILVAGFAAASITRLSAAAADSSLGPVPDVAAAAAQGADAMDRATDVVANELLLAATGDTPALEDEPALSFAGSADGVAAPLPEAQAAEPPAAAAADVSDIASASTAAIRMSVPFRTQKDGDRFQGSNCGPAALRMVLAAFGMEFDNSDLRFLTHTYQGTVGARTGTALQHVAHVAADFGLQPVGLYQRPGDGYPNDGFARWTVDDIRAEVLAGHPVVPLVKFRLLPGHEDSPFRADHYIVIHGVDGDSFLYHDPIYESPAEGGARWISAEQLEAAMRPTLVPQQAVAFAPGTHGALPAFNY